MTALKIAGLVLSLGLDTFSVSVALGLGGLERHDRLRVGLSFSIFEGLMPLVGFFAGRALSSAVGDAASLAGIAILFAVGLWMIYESVEGEEEATPAISSLKGLALTSLSVSMDELAVGFSLGLLGLPILVAAVLIAAQAFVFTYIGTTIGNRIGSRFAERGELVAGIVLGALAVLLFAERLVG
jgi:putative Mn2+ efflux pump MntP